MAATQLLKKTYGMSEDAAKWLTKELGEPAARELANQPSRAVDVGTRNLGSSASTSAKFVGGGAAVGGGSLAAAEAFGDYQQRQTQKDITSLQKRRQKMLSKIANDDSMSPKQKQELIKAMENSGAFERPNAGNGGGGSGLSLPMVGEVDPMVVLLVLAVVLIIAKNADVGSMTGGGA